jgi:hypothetical protein
MVYKLLRRLIASQHTRAFLIILLILIAAYAIPPVMHRSQNPILQRSGLSAELSPGLVSGQSTIDPNDGFTSQALGHRAADSWLSGSVPYWNHYEGLGAPLAGGMQAAAFFPLILLLHFGNGLVYFHFLLQLIAGMAAYLFFRKLKLKFSIAVLGGVLFALNGAFAWLTNAPFNPIAFLPLLLLGIEHAITCTEKKKRGGWIPIALALSLSFYAGFPETAFINAIFAYGWGAARLFYLDKKIRKPYIYKVLLGSIAGLLLAAPALVTFVGYLPYAITGGHSGGVYANIGLPIATLPALFMPYIFGPIFGFVNAGKPQDLFLFWSNVGGYLTMPLLLVGLLGLYAKRSRGLKLYLAVFSVIVVLKIYGFKPVSLLINFIPGMDQIAFYRYSVPALSFAVIMLAMFGVEAVAKREIARRKTIILTAVVSLFTILLGLFARRLLHQLLAFPSHRWWAIFSVCWALSVLIVIVLAFLRTQLRLWGIMLLLGITSFAMFVTPFLSLPKMSKVDQAPVSYLQKNIGLNRFYTLHPFAPNYGSYFETASINTNDLPIPKKWADYVPQKLDSNANALVFTGYSRINADGPSALEEFGRNLNQYEAVGVKYLVADHTQVKQDFSRQYGLTLAFSDSLVDIFELPRTAPYYESSAPCEFAGQTLDSVQVDCRSQSTISRHELYLPGWSASVSGTNRQVKSDQGIFQKVDVPQGKSRVKFLYNPPFIGVGYAAFALGLTMIVAQVIISSTGRNRSLDYFLRAVRLK